MLVAEAGFGFAPAFHFGGVNGFVVGPRLGGSWVSRGFQRLGVAKGVDADGDETGRGRDPTAESLLNGHLNFFLMR